MAYCQHGIGIVFFYGKDCGVLRNIAKRIKIAQNDMRRQSQFIDMGQTAVSSQKKVVFSNRLY